MKVSKTVIGTLLCFVVFFTINHPGVLAQQSTVRLPEGISLVWEADTYTPPFYKGKALYAPGGDMRIVAFPDERFGNPENLLYEWSVDGTVLGTQSGVGVQVFNLVGNSIVQNPLITVSIRESVDGPVLAAAGMRPQITTPFVSLYEINPIQGTQFQKIVAGEIEMQENEITLSAYPYFFSTKQREDLNYTWGVNGSAVGNAPSLTFRKEEGSGISSVSLKITHPNKLFQQASESFIVSL